jgi:pimeloyl-ACP methyl ester carboxylesterase
VEKKIEFLSKGRLIRGVLCLPDLGAGPFALMVMAGGWCYVKEIVIPTYAAALAVVGCASLRFDYRSLGESEGEPRQHLDPWAQIEDYRNAISYAAAESKVDSERIGVWGISYSGGHALILAAIDARVKCAVANIPLIDGYQTMRLVHGYGKGRFARLCRAIEDDRERRYRGQPGGYIPHNTADPDREICTWPFTTSNEFFSYAKKTFAPNYEPHSTIESTEMLMAYSVLGFLGRILDTPIQMLVVEGDEHTPWDLQLHAFQAIASVRKELAVMKNVTHIGLYAKRDFQKQAAARNADFVRRHLIASA